MILFNRTVALTYIVVVFSINMRQIYTALKDEDMVKWISIEQPCSVTRVVQFLWGTTLYPSHGASTKLLSTTWKKYAQNTWLQRYFNQDEEFTTNQTKKHQSNRLKHRGTLQISQWHGGWRAEPQDDSQGSFFSWSWEGIPGTWLESGIRRQNVPSLTTIGGSICSVRSKARYLVYTEFQWH